MSYESIRTPFCARIIHLELTLLYRTRFPIQHLINRIEIVRNGMEWNTIESLCVENDVNNSLPATIESFGSDLRHTRPY